MKRIYLSLACCFALCNSFAQNLGEQNMTATIDLQPILQLNTQAKSIEFNFNDIADYTAGVVQYAATTLKVTSTVNWDLYAIGTSSGNVGSGYWDQMASYNSNSQTKSTNKIPLSALEIKQSTPNQNASGASGIYKDYSSSFPPASSPAGERRLHRNPRTL